MTKNNRAKKSPPKNKRGRPPASDTAERLLDCALTVFADKGYAAASTREIIEAAGVSKPVLYYHCASKADLFRRLVRGIYEAGLREWEQIFAAETTCSARLRAMTRSTFAGCARDPRIPRLMFQTHYGPPLAELGTFMEKLTQRRFAQVARVMHDALAAGEIAGGDAASLALAFCCLADQHCNVLARLPAPARHLTPALADALVDTFLHGTGTTRRTRPAFPPFAKGGA